jgi:hypothetical protein
MVAQMVWYVFSTVAMLIGSGLYVSSARHAERRPVLAYLIFVTSLLGGEAVLFSVGVLLLLLSGSEHFLEEPLLAGLFLLAVVVPAFVFARQKIRRPPWMAVRGKTEPEDLVGWEPEAVRTPADATRPLRRAGLV